MNHSSSRSFARHPIATEPPNPRQTRSGKPFQRGDPLPASQPQAAFTRLELLAVLTGLALLATIALPVLAGNRLQTDRVSCVNNLRRIGQAYHLWGDDHGEGLPIRTSNSQGGLFDATYSASPYINNTWFHFAWISNELVTPRILACPSDGDTRVARDFSTSPDGGFLNPNQRSRAVSYFVSLDVFPGQSRLFISGDRNVKLDYLPASCSSGVTMAGTLYNPQSQTEWLPGLHGQSGNLLIADGHVQQTSSEGLRRYLDEEFRYQGENGAFHVLLPRY